MTNRLTSREIQIVELLSQGMTSKDIADRLWVSPHTVKTHISRIGRKLGFLPSKDHRQTNLRTGIVTTAIELGYIQTPSLSGEDLLAMPVLYGLPALREDLMLAIRAVHRDNTIQEKAHRQRVLFSLHAMVEQIDKKGPSADYAGVERA